MSSKEPTKADLAAAVAKLTEENKGLRELLAAVSAVADTVPVSKDNNSGAEWQRSSRVLSNIKILSGIGDWPGYLAWAAGELRSIAAEPPGYEVYEAFAAPAKLDGPDTAPHPRADETDPCATCGHHRGSHGLLHCAAPECGCAHFRFAPVAVSA